MFQRSLDEDVSFQVHSVPATASGYHLQDMSSTTQPTHLHWTGTCSQKMRGLHFTWKQTQSINRWWPTLVGLHLVQVTEVATGRSSPPELHCGIVSTHTYSTINEVESTVLCIVRDLETRLDELLVRSAVGGHHSQIVDTRTQSRELYMATGACSVYMRRRAVYQLKPLVDKQPLL